MINGYDLIVRGFMERLTFLRGVNPQIKYRNPINGQ